MLEALTFDFVRNAIFAGILASIACGVIGSLVVVNRIVFISGGIAHAAYGGIGIALFFGLSPLLGAVGFSIAVAVLTAWISQNDKARADTVIGVFWAAGMAIGVVFIDLTPGYKADLMSYLFGSILYVPLSDIYLMAILDFIMIGLTWFFYRDILAMSFDEEFAVTRGVKVRSLYVIMLIMIALAVVLLIRVAGLILVIALLTIPPFIAEHRTKTLFGMMFLAGILSAVFTLSGLFVSYQFDLTSGPVIILTSVLVFLLSILYDRYHKTGNRQI